MIDFATLSLFGVFLLGVGFIAVVLFYLNRGTDDQHPAPGE